LKPGLPHTSSRLVKLIEKAQNPEITQDLYHSDFERWHESLQKIVLDAEEAIGQKRDKVQNLAQLLVAVYSEVSELS